MLYLLEQQRARNAWEAVSEIRALAEKAEKTQKRFRSQVRGGPAMVQRNGLGQFLAFLAASGFIKGDQLATKEDDRADGLLYQYLGRWLIQALRLQTDTVTLSAIKPGSGSDPLAFLLKSDTNLEQTMHATREVLAWMQWARRFAESQLSQPDEGK